MVIYPTYEDDGSTHQWQQTVQQGGLRLRLGRPQHRIAADAEMQSRQRQPRCLRGIQVKLRMQVNFADPRSAALVQLQAPQTSRPRSNAPVRGCSRAASSERMDLKEAAQQARNPWEGTLRGLHEA